MERDKLISELQEAAEYVETEFAAGEDVDIDKIQIDRQDGNLKIWFT